MTDKFFYCILFIHKNGKRGYIYRTPQNQIEISPTFIDVCIKFDSYGDTNDFIRKEKLNNWKGWKPYIRDTSDIQREQNKDVRKGQGYYRIVNELGQSAFFNKDKKQYYWKASEKECTVWENQASAEEFIPKMKRYFPNMQFSAKPYGD